MGGYVCGKSILLAALAADVQWRLHSLLAAGMAAMHISMVPSAELEGGWNNGSGGGWQPAIL